MPYTLPPITLTQNQTSIVSIPGSLGSVTYLKMVNASPYLLAINNLLGGSDYMQPGEANVWPVPGLTTAVQATPQQFGVSPVIIPSSVLVVTWYLEGEQPNGNYPVNFNTISFLGGNVTTNVSTPNSLEQDMLTPFVLFGLTAAKDGTLANQLDVAGGVALVRQSDNSLGRVAPAATTFATTAPTATYFLDLQPDGSYSFATTHSGQPNYLPIAQVTTDGSGNIATVTDERVLSTTLLTTIVGQLTLPALSGLTADGVVNIVRTLSGSQKTFIALKPSDGTEWDIDSDASANLNLVNAAHGRVAQFSALGALTVPSVGFASGGEIDYESNAVVYRPLETGAVAQGHVFQIYTGATTKNPFGVGNAAAGTSQTYFDDLGSLTSQAAIVTLGGQVSVGSFGVPVIVAQAIQQHVAAVGNVNVLTFTCSATGLYRVSGHIHWSNGSNSAVVASATFTDPNGAAYNNFLATTASGSATVTLLSGSNTFIAGAESMPLLPLTSMASSGASIICKFNDPSGTPNDFVTYIIERLS